MSKGIEFLKIYIFSILRRLGLYFWEIIKDLWNTTKDFVKKSTGRG